MLYICHREDSKGRPMYVWDIPHRVKGAYDWGYTSKAENAKPLSEYWKARFMADCEYCGSRGSFFAL